MIKLSEIPNISKEFEKIINAYIDLDGEARQTIPLVEQFLIKYPYYPEAFNFLSILYIADNQLPKAMKCIKALKKIDPWRLHGAFDKAEALIAREKSDEGIEAFVNGIRAYAYELLNGIDNFISSTEPADKDKFQKLVFNAIMTYMKNKGHNEKVFDELRNDLSEWKFEFINE